jgi:hypothetical protein
MLERSKDEEEEVEKYSILSQVGKPSGGNGATDRPTR